MTNQSNMECEHHGRMVVHLHLDKLSCIYCKNDKPLPDDAPKTRDIKDMMRWCWANNIGIGYCQPMPHWKGEDQLMTISQSDEAVIQLAKELDKHPAVIAAALVNLRDKGLIK